jgi:hypothetical protein
VPIISLGFWVTLANLPGLLQYNTDFELVFAFKVNIFFFGKIFDLVFCPFYYIVLGRIRDTF